MGVKSVGSVSFGIFCCCGSCLTIFVFGIATVLVTVFISGLAIFFANATKTSLDIKFSKSIDIKGFYEIFLNRKLVEREGFEPSIRY